MVVHQSGIVCPIHVVDNQILTYLTRRSFWNEKYGRPMNFPGEWVFAGGFREAYDIDLAATGVRELGEETPHEGEVSNVHKLREGRIVLQGNEHYGEFFGASVDLLPTTDVHLSSEVIDIGWDHPEMWLEYILSSAFHRQQLEAFEREGLGDLKFGNYAVTDRRLPEQVILTLQHMVENTPELIRIYG